MKPLSTEKRALLAFLISMVMFVAYDALYLAPRMKAQRAKREAEALQQARENPPAPRPAADSTRLEAAAPSAGAASPGVRALDVPDSLGARPEKQIVVASPLYELTLSSRGGEITSVRILRYVTKGMPVELIPEGESWSGRRMLAASLRSEAATLPLDGVVFDVMSGSSELSDGARVVVAGDTPVDVTFRAQTAAGIIERSYRFRGDRYDFVVTLRA